MNKLVGQLNGQRKIIVFMVGISLLGLSQIMYAHEYASESTADVVGSAGSAPAASPVASPLAEVKQRLSSAAESLKKTQIQDTIKPTPAVVPKKSTTTTTKTSYDRAAAGKSLGPTPSPSIRYAAKITPTPTAESYRQEVYVKPTPTPVKKQTIVHTKVVEDEKYRHPTPEKIKAATTVHHAAPTTKPAEVVYVASEPRYVANDSHNIVEASTIVVKHDQPKELPSTGPELPIAVSIGGIVSALVARKYFLAKSGRL